MRPSGLTAFASVITRAAPPIARLPRWTKCQSLANPSTEEYSHIGETAMRCGSVRLRSFSGEKRWFVGWVTGIGCSRIDLEAFSHHCMFEHDRSGPQYIRD